MRSKTRFLLCLALAGSTLAAATLAEEITVQIDSWAPPSQPGLQANFGAGDEVGVVLTSPCNGTIVALQVGWASQFGGSEPSLQRYVRVYADAGTFPTPGAELLLLVAPVLQDPFVNEFRYLDEDNLIPINVPVTAGQKFFVTLEFDEATDILNGDAAVFHDIQGCTNGVNVLRTPGGGWQNLCSLGWLGNTVIRAVIDCAGVTGACCRANGTCTPDVEENECQAFGDIWSEGMSCQEVACEARGACCIGTGCLTLATEATCIGAGGTYAGDGTDCAASVCVEGACCNLTTGECSLELEVDCLAAGGAFEGPGTSCTPNPCTQPVGACCVGTSCFPDQTSEDCATVSGVWMGAGASCVPNPCLAPAGCQGDYDCDADRDFDDINYLVAALGGEQAWIDFHISQTGNPPSCQFAQNCDPDGQGDGSTFDDINPFVDLLGDPCP